MNPVNLFYDCGFRAIVKVHLDTAFGGLQHPSFRADPESRISFWIPAFAGMMNLIHANI